MNKLVPFYRKHPDPVVEIILNTELGPEQLMAALSIPAFASNPKVQAMGLIMLSDMGLRPFEEANNFAESVYLVPCHVDLQLIFLASWYGTFLHSKVVPIDQMKAIQAVMNSLVSEQTLPEIKALVRIAQGLNCSCFGDFSAMFSILKSLLDDIPRESYFYKKLAVIRSMAFFAHGMGSSVEDVLDLIDPSDMDGKGVTLARLANCALTGNLEKVPELMQLFAAYPDHKYRRLNYGTVETSCTLIRLISKLQGVEVKSKIILDESKPNQSWARSTQALIEHKTEEALYWARIFTDEMSLRAGEPINFLEHTLVRAELAMRNGSGAKRLLNQLRQKGTETYIDDFYFARAELLLGNREQALNHYAKVVASVEQYQARKRFDFEVTIACELKASDLLDLGREAIEISRLQLKIPVSSGVNPKGIEAIISVSESMQKVKDNIQTFADLNLPVLITGETGTGKELVAQALHEMRGYKDRPFIAINCGAVSDALIESEFFGHAHGAFTGAQSAYKGIFREAGEGTVFLDEIADISPQLQLSLLRVLESGEVRPVGSSALFLIKCRVVVATNKPLLQLVEEGKFRQDLYYRLQRLEIKLPALRERPDDIEVLVRYFFNVDRNSGEQTVLSEDLVSKYKAYSWPGNVRELRNSVQRIRILSSDKLSYDLEDLDRCGCLFENEVIQEISEDSGSRLISNTTQEDQVTLTESFEKGIAGSSSSFRRKRRLRELFDLHGELKVSEVAEMLGVTLNTASSYMMELCKEGIAEKVTPTASRQSHYYAKKKH